MASLVYSFRAYSTSATVCEELVLGCPCAYLTQATAEVILNNVPTEDTKHHGQDVQYARASEGDKLTIHKAIKITNEKKNDMRFESLHTVRKLKIYRAPEYC